MKKYPESLINNTMEDEKVIKIHRLTETKRIIKQAILYILNLKPKNTEIYRHIYLNLPGLIKGKRMKNLLQKYPIIKPKRQPNSQIKILANANHQFTNKGCQVKRFN